MSQREVRRGKARGGQQPQAGGQQGSPQQAQTSNLQLALKYQRKAGNYVYALAAFALLVSAIMPYRSMNPGEFDGMSESSLELWIIATVYVSFALVLVVLARKIYKGSTIAWIGAVVLGLGVGGLSYVTGATAVTWWALLLTAPIVYWAYGARHELLSGGLR